MKDRTAAEDDESKASGESGNNDRSNKRKAESPPLEDASLGREEEEDNTESRSKRRKQEETSGSNRDVDKDDNKQGEGHGLKDGSERDEKTSQKGKAEKSGSKEKNDSETAAKDMEVEKNESPLPDSGVGSSRVTDDDKKTDKDTKSDLATLVDGDKKSQDPSTEGVKNESNPGASSSTSLNGQETTGDAAANKTRAGSSNPYDSLKYIMVRNDGKPESLIKLVALKSLFSRQLPKMPRTYIARLVFDRRHTSLVILNDDPATKDTDEEVIGSICYRAFPEMRFAEIAFCAVNASHQVKGYGTKLMNLVKKEGARTGIEYFITYADNYAIGYFKKQGFTKNISMPKGRYQGLIKEYDGGTMMECYVHPSIDFTRIPEMLAAQREFILSRIRLKAQSHRVVYDPLPKNWKPHLEGVSRANESAARALAVPGMIEAGWTLADLMATTGQGKDLDRAKNALKSDLIGIVRKVEEQQFSWPFREPVDTNEVKDYLEIIKEPIDLMTIDKRIRKGDHYKSKKMLYADLMLMVNNCKLYNDEASTYVHCAVSLERFLNTLFASK